MQRKDALTWFEIPATDLTRARRFYETILATELRLENMGPSDLAVFPYAEPAVGGCLIHGSGYQPSSHGAVVYLNAGERLDPVLARIAAAGGSIALPKTALPDGMGCFAHIVDSEGNRVGLHASQ